MFLFAIFSLFTLTDAVKWHQLNDYTFDKYIIEFNKNYDENEYEYRKAIFEANLDEVKNHNSDLSKTWKMGVNHMTDYSNDEYNMLLGGGISINRRNAVKLTQEVFETVDTATGVDWRDAGIVSAVKDQGRCGSCWTFGASETLESYWAMATGQLVDLSEQQILDCTPNVNECGGTGGCFGGTAEIAYAKMVEMGGLASEWTYPYQSYFGKAFTCRSENTVPYAHVTGYVNLPENDYQSVLYALTTIGTLVVNVDASTWKSYEGGVFNGCNQTNPNINHVVQLVGYGTDPKLGDYWLVRNSWTPNWGEHGYIRLARRANPLCGVDDKPQNGVGCKDGPKSVKVCGTCGVLYDALYPTVPKKV